MVQWKLQRGRRSGRGGGRRRSQYHSVLPLHHFSHLSNTVSCWYCDYKFSVFNKPLFCFGQKYSRYLRIWFSVGMGFSLTTLVGVTMIIVLELARSWNMYSGAPWLSSILQGPFLGIYSSAFKLSISVADVGYMCVSSIISVSIHELGHALAAGSEGVQIEYTAVFLAVLFPGALVAFNHELLQMMPRLATLRVYCAGIWHNAALCAICALTLLLLPLILYPLYKHGENLMVLDVSSKSPLSAYLSPGDLITSLDGKLVHTTEEWMEMAELLSKQIYQTKTTDYNRKKGYCVPNSVIAESKNVQIVDNQTMCPNDLTLFTTISCFDLTLDNSSSIMNHHPLTLENVYCLPAKGALGEKKCGDGWVNQGKNYSYCVCSEEESCSTPVQMPGLPWVEITKSRPYSPECLRIGNKSTSSYNNPDPSENGCGGTFIFIGDMILMSNSIWLTEYQPRWSFGVVAYIPSVLEKALMNTFYVSLSLALLNSLPVYYLDGESILEVALCCISFLTPRTRKAVLRASLLAGTLISVLLIWRIFFLVIL